MAFVLGVNHLGSIWYHSEPSDVPYSPIQFPALDSFCRFLQQDGSNGINKESRKRLAKPSVISIGILEEFKISIKLISRLFF